MSSFGVCRAVDLQYPEPEEIASLLTPCPCVLQAPPTLNLKP